MTLIRLNEISIEFGDTPLLSNTGFAIEQNERICLIGRNGAGKTTLLKILAGSIEADSGSIHRQQMLRISQLDQNLPASRDDLVFDVVREGLADQSALIQRYEALASGEELPPGSSNGGAQRYADPLEEMSELQAAIEAGGGWNLDKQVEKFISQLDLPANKKLSELSGGWRRRVALGKALVSEPNLLLLDEPTNHLDISTIEWLEHVVRGYRGSVVFITHDRNFLQTLATRIIEIDRGKIIDWPGSYNNFLKLKEQSLKDESQHNALFDKKLALEETWIRQGVKARRTRNEGRVRALEKMRRERAERFKRQGRASIHVETAEQSGRKVCEMRAVTHSYNNESLIKNLKLKIMRGDRIGLIGNNGVGKSTLLKILLGMVEPDQGSVKLGTNLEMGYFDQVKRELDPDKSIAENVGMGRDFIQINGKDRHIISYLQNFLFAPKRAMTPVKALSGGERNRVSLAKLFSKPSNLLVLDEPTNDLDIEMLEVLEERLVAYEGTLLIVSHDREFLDNVVTSILVFEDDGNVHEYVGGFSDWANRGKALKISDTLSTATNSAGSGTAASVSPTAQLLPKKNKLSYKIQRELDQLPGEIDKLEIAISSLEKKVANPEFYEAGFHETQPLLDELGSLQSRLDERTARWVELEELSSQ